ncbi:MAG: pentapeptide repeat-containing protein [Romboutsia sp.]
MEIKKTNDQFSYKNRKKLNSDFMNKDLRRSNCYNCDFTESNFNYTSFRGAQFKSCNFNKCTFEFTEFVAANFKRSYFKNAKFENTIFDTVNLEGVNLEGAEFKNVIFVSTDVSKAGNFDIENPNIKIYDKMPKLKISKSLETTVKDIMKNSFIKASRVLDTKDKKINPLSMIILLENFDEETLIKGLNIFEEKLEHNFSTLGHIIKCLQNYKLEGII